MWRSKNLFAVLGLILGLQLSLWSQLRITVHAVGHGEMIELSLPSGKTYLIDCGDKFSSLAHRALKTLPGRLEGFFASHGHDDHIGNIEQILPKTDRLYDGGLEYPSQAQEEFYEAVTRGKKLTILTQGDELSLDSEVKLKILWPPRPLLRGTNSDPNNNSLVMMLIYDEFKLLLTGDIEEAGLREFLRTKPDLRCTVVKVPHHGSRGSFLPAFISGLKARWALVSAAKDGDPTGHGLPHEDCLEAYRQAGAEVFVTGRDGSIRIFTDGKFHSLSLEP